MGRQHDSSPQPNDNICFDLRFNFGMRSGQQGVDHRADIEFLQVGVLLPHSNIEDGFGGGIHQGKGGSNFVIDCVELGQDNGIDACFVGICGLLLNCLIELSDLIDSVVAHQCLSDEHYKVGFVYLNNLRQLFHEGLVVLHPACCVNQDHVYSLASGLNKIVFTSRMASKAMLEGSSL